MFFLIFDLSPSSIKFDEMFFIVRLFTLLVIQ